MVSLKAKFFWVFLCTATGYILIYWYSLHAQMHLRGTVWLPASHTHAQTQCVCLPLGSTWGSVSCGACGGGRGASLAISGQVAPPPESHVPL